jgi:predicted N-acetyltransferase YhbS
MGCEMQIRPELPGDASAIHALTQTAFKGQPEPDRNAP